MTAPSVIVIGGSAGALDIVLEVLPALSDELAIPIVVVLHISPDHPSLLPELLARVCRRPVVEAEDKLALRPHTIQVAPPNYHVLIERGGSLALSVDPPVHFSRPSIDVLFESAADSLGASVAGVILSGANEDGARGLGRIRDAGGVAIIQQPETAQHAMMPAAALRCVGPAARVVPVGGLAHLLSMLGETIAPDPECAR
jgi:two-component system chemotaxis response regulator CheB